MFYVYSYKYSMPGSDIVLGAVHNGKGTITDRWASQFTLPAIDDCQVYSLTFLPFPSFAFPRFLFIHSCITTYTFILIFVCTPQLIYCNKDWVLVSASESEGYTTLELKRLLDTKDAQDRGMMGKEGRGREGRREERGEWRGRRGGEKWRDQNDWSSYFIHPKPSSLEQTGSWLHLEKMALMIQGINIRRKKTAFCV